MVVEPDEEGERQPDAPEVRQGLMLAGRLERAGVALGAEHAQALTRVADPGLVPLELGRGEPALEQGGGERRQTARPGLGRPTSHLLANTDRPRGQASRAQRTLPG